MASSASSPTPKLLQQICRSLDLYQTPELNDKLYLHYKGFTHIAHLEPYTGLKVLYLEGNALTSLEGLSGQHSLRCLYAQENCLDSLDSLCALQNLSTLNVSTNFISSLPTCWLLADRLPALHTLSLSHNRLASVQSLHSLTRHPTIAVLDLQHNRIGAHTDSGQQEAAAANVEFESLLALLATLPQLRVLYLAGNPLLSSLTQYRRRTLAALPQLTYLDERPVFEEEKRMVAAWHRGGVEEEREEKSRLRREEREKERRQWDLFDRLVNEAASEKEQQEHDELAKQASHSSRQEQQPQPHSSKQAVSVGSSEWEEKQQMTESAAVEDGVMLEEGLRVGEASVRQSAMQAWLSGSADGKQTQQGQRARLELVDRGRSAVPRQGSMLIEVIDSEVDA